MTSEVRQRELIRHKNETRALTKQLSESRAAEMVALAEVQVLRAMRDSLYTRNATLANMVRWSVMHEGECLGDWPHLLEAARAALEGQP